jgi:hypothetical protein
VCDSWGEERGALPPSALPGISPTRGEIGKTHLYCFNLQLCVGRDRAADRSPPLWGRCPAGQRGVKPHALSVYWEWKCPKPNSFIPPSVTGRGYSASGDCPAALRLGLVWVGCVAQPGLSPCRISQAAVHRLLRNGPFHERCQRSTTRTVPRFPPRLASTRRDCV